MDVRELDQIRVELDRLQDRTTNVRIDVTALESKTEQRFDHILACLETIRKDMETLSTSVQQLETLATEGRTSLKTLLWVGGAVAGVTAFLLMIYGYIPK